MSITSLGIGSGLDLNGLVGQLVASERDPKLAQFDRVESATRAELSALGQVRSSLSALAGAADSLGATDAFGQFAATTSASEALTVSAGASAQAGTYTARVLNLASAHKLSSDPFADVDTDVGPGTVTIDMGGQAFSVTLADDADTLTDIRDAINAAADNPGVTASIITADDGARLVLEADATGAANALTVTVDVDPLDVLLGNDGLEALIYDPGTTTNMTEQREADDARLSVDGFTRSSATNTVDDAVSGLRFNLLEADPDRDITVAVTADESGSASRIESFVTAYNNAQVTLTAVSRAVPNGDSGPLVGDSATRRATQTLRNMMSEALGEAGGYLWQIGIDFETDGTMRLDSDALATALADDSESVAGLFNGDAGLVARMTGFLDGYTDPDGLLDGREAGANARLEALEPQRERVNTRAAALEARLNSQFAAMDALVAQLQTTGTYLNQQLANLPGFGGPNTQGA